MINIKLDIVCLPTQVNAAYYLQYYYITDYTFIIITIESALTLCTNN